jgi:Protein of unknown function (DUF3141)
MRPLGMVVDRYFNAARVVRSPPWITESGNEAGKSRIMLRWVLPVDDRHHRDPRALCRPVPAPGASQAYLCREHVRLLRRECISGGARHGDRCQHDWSGLERNGRRRASGSGGQRAAARVSDINLGLYRAVLAPIVRTAVTEPAAEMLRATHPNRLRFAAFSDRNPLMLPVKPLADAARAARQPVSADNPLLAMERATSSWITTCLETFGEFRDFMTEAVFLNTYGSPLLQAFIGLGAQQAAPHQVEKDLVREAHEARLQSELQHRFDVGGLEEAAVRALVYIRLPKGSVDERGFTVLKLIRASRPVGKRMSLARFKEIMREQYLIVRLDEDRALEALPKLLGADDAGRKARRQSRRSLRRWQGGRMFLWFPILKLAICWPRVCRSLPRPMRRGLYSVHAFQSS